MKILFWIVALKQQGHSLKLHACKWRLVASWQLEVAEVGKYSGRMVKISIGNMYMLLHADGWHRHFHCFQLFWVVLTHVFSLTGSVPLHFPLVLFHPTGSHSLHFSRPFPFIRIQYCDILSLVAFIFLSSTNCGHQKSVAMSLKPVLVFWTRICNAARKLKLPFVFGTEVCPCFMFEVQSRYLSLNGSRHD